jgi:hypothetical protein
MTIGMLQRNYRNFDLTIKESFKWISAINSLASTYKKLSNEHIFYSYEYGFLKIFTGWERFVEQTFIAYMTGRHIKGRVHKTFIKKINTDHALRLLSGTGPYPDWTRFDEIYKLAELYFIDHEALTLPLKQIETKFNDIKKIRNSIVHMSTAAREKFQGLLRANLSGYRIDMTAGEFLSGRKTGRKTFFEYYVSYLETAASNLTSI